MSEGERRRQQTCKMERVDADRWPPTISSSRQTPFAWDGRMYTTGREIDLYDIVYIHTFLKEIHVISKNKSTKILSPHPRKKNKKTKSLIPMGIFSGPPDSQRDVPQCLLGPRHNRCGSAFLGVPALEHYQWCQWLYPSFLFHCTKF